MTTTVREQFNQLPEDDQDRVLHLGMTMFESGRTSLLGIGASEEREKADAQIRAIREEANAKATEQEEQNQRIVDGLKDQIATLKDTIVSLKEGHTNILRELREKSNAEIEEKAALLAKAKVTFVEEELARERIRMEERERVNDETAYKLAEATERIMGITENSSKRGRVGEAVAAEEVRRVFKDASDITDTATEGGCGDIHVTFPGVGKFILDIKNHAKGSGGVRKKDRDKLLRDIDDDKNDAVGGILVASQASIQGMEPGSVIYSKKGRPMVACELRGEWDRLTDAKNTIVNILSVKKTHTADITDSKSEPGVDVASVSKAFDKVIGCLKEKREEEYRQIINTNTIIGQTLHNKAIATNNPTDVTNMEDWLLDCCHVTKAKESVDMKDIFAKYQTACEKKTPDAPKPKKATITKQKQTIRDYLIRMGKKVV